MADDILDQIDHAIQDWAVSGDAMRWSPEAPEEDPYNYPGLDDLWDAVRRQFLRYLDRHFDEVFFGVPVVESPWAQHTLWVDGWTPAGYILDETQAFAPTTGPQPKKKKKKKKTETEPDPFDQLHRDNWVAPSRLEQAGWTSEFR